MDENNFISCIQKCPKCESSNSTRKDLIFKVSYCGHSICSGCYSLLVERNEDNCVVCGEKFNRSKFRNRKYDNDEVESYMSYYNDVKRIYNCELVDFDSLEEYNNYLEEVEMLILDLMDKSTCEKARMKMNEYSNANKAAIKARRNRMNPDFEEYTRLEAKNAEMMLKSEEVLQQRQEDRVNMQKELTARLINSLEPVDDICKEYDNRVKNRGEEMALHAATMNTMSNLKCKVAMEAVPFVYERPSYMKRDAFSYKLSNDNNNNHDRIVQHVLLQTLGDQRSSTAVLRTEGGYTGPFWFYRLRHFCH